jgi:HPt (histidine-containing phosphotransfer) domain-containing protein
LPVSGGNVDLQQQTNVTACSINTDALDLTAIDRIRQLERQTGKPLLSSLFEGYIKQMDEKLIEIRRDLQFQDATSTYRTAHAIKSMSANIGADKVKAISFEIEKMGKAQDLSGASDAMGLLSRAYDEFVREFARL